MGLSIKCTRQASPWIGANYNGTVHPADVDIVNAVDCIRNASEQRMHERSLECADIPVERDDDTEPPLECLL